MLDAAFVSVDWRISGAIVAGAAILGALAAFSKQGGHRVAQRMRRPGARAADEGAGSPTLASGSVQEISLENAALVAAYVAVDISVYVVAERASQGFVQQTLLFANAIISILIGSGISFHTAGMGGIRECFEPRRVARLLPVAVSFCLSMLGLLLSFQYFDGAFIKLLGQIKLPFTALLSSVLLARRFSLMQWQVICLICATCTSFTALKFEAGPTVASADAGSRGSQAAGLLLILVWVVFNVVGSLLAEKAYKKRDAPIVVVITNLRVGELLASTAMLACLPNFAPSRFFAGWDSSTLAVLIMLVLDNWLSALVVQRLSTVAKSIAKCVTLVVLYVTALITGRQPLDVAQGLGALMIVQTTVLFASLTARSSS